MPKVSYLSFENALGEIHSNLHSSALKISLKQENKLEHFYWQVLTMWPRQISRKYCLSGEGIVLDFRSGFKRLAKIQMKKLVLSAADCIVCLFVCISISFILRHVYVFASCDVANDLL